MSTNVQGKFNMYCTTTQQDNHNVNFNFSSFVSNKIEFSMTKRYSKSDLTDALYSFPQNTMTTKRALIVVDMQNDFVRPSGSLYVPDSESMIDDIRNLISKGNYDYIVFTQDWHPSNHSSFQEWPVHCVQHSHGAEIVKELTEVCDPRSTLVIQKGWDSDDDSYGAFYTSNKRYSNGLSEALKSRGVGELHIVGVAGEYCVYHTAVQGREAGFNVSVHLSLVKGLKVHDMDLANLYLEHDLKVLINPFGY
jgi:nicotinamidase/pyrazinamidase